MFTLRWKAREERLVSMATEMSAPCSAQRRPAQFSALRRADLTSPLCVPVLDSTGCMRHFNVEAKKMYIALPKTYRFQILLVTRAGQNMLARSETAMQVGWAGGDAERTECQRYKRPVEAVGDFGITERGVCASTNKNNFT